MSDVGRFRRRTRPFDFLAGAPRPGRYPPDGLGIQGSIEAVRFAPVEVGHGFDAEGRQVFRHVGSEDMISGISLQDLAHLTGGTFVHNHPPYEKYSEVDPRRRAGSFSALDLIFMYEHNLIQLIAVTRERTYVLRRRPEGFFLDPGQIRVVYARHVRRVRRRLRRLAASGIISREEAGSDGRLADEVMDRMGNAFDYHWEEARNDAPGSR